MSHVCIATKALYVSFKHIVNTSAIGYVKNIANLLKIVCIIFKDSVYSTAISSVKQAIESFNYWIIQKTNIQHASKVRSSAGLISLIFARIACAFLCF